MCCAWETYHEVNKRLRSVVSQNLLLGSSLHCKSVISNLNSNETALTFMLNSKVKKLKSM